MNADDLAERLARKSHHVARIHHHLAQLTAACWEFHEGNGRCAVRLAVAELEKQTLQHFRVESYDANISDGPPILIALQSYDPLTEIVVIVDYDAEQPAVYVTGPHVALPPVHD
jgi:hypothetical protein